MTKRNANISMGETSDGVCSNFMHVCACSDNVMSSNDKTIGAMIGPRIFPLGQTKIPNICSKFGLCKPQTGELKMGSHRF